MAICFEHGLTLLKSQVWYPLDGCATVLHETVQTCCEGPLLWLHWARTGTLLTVTGRVRNLHRCSRDHQNDKRGREIIEMQIQFQECILLLCM